MRFLTGRRWRVSVVLWCVVLAAFGGCSVSLQLPGVSASPSSAACASTTESGCAVGSGATNLQLFTEPDDGITPVTNVIHGALHSVWVEVYELTNTSIITALEDAANQGRDVRVMLDPHPLGASATSVTETLDKLKAAGIKTNTSNPTFTYTHAKFMIIDGKVLFLMTANLSFAALGSTRSKATNREYLLNDTNTPDVQEAENIFTNDWNRTTPTLSDANLVVSPVNARSDLLSLINSAHSSLDIEDEEMADQSSEDAMVQAAKRGVQVEVILPAKSGWSTSTAKAVSYLLSNHVSVRADNQLYMHAKLIIVDGTKAFVGSENFSSTSLDQNRELGMLIAETTLIQSLDTTFMSDYAMAQ